MSGHSKWASIKHKKAITDAKRGKAFTKIVKEISTAARLGGGDADSNPRLRTAIDAAKDVNMPHDNIKKAIMKGTGALPGMSYEEFLYEGYGPAGVAVMVEVMTDNKNRTVPEIRFIMSKNGGSLGESGCVSWMFARKGQIMIEKTAIEEDALMELVLENGAEDMKVEDDSYVVSTAPEDYETVLDAIKAKQIPIASSEIGKFPSTYTKLEGKHAEQMLKLVDKLEELDDVQNVWSNFDIDEADLENYSGD